MANPHLELHFRIVCVKFNRQRERKREREWRKTRPFQKKTKSAHRESLSFRELKKAPFKPHFPKEMPIKYGNRISRRARCFLNCFWKAQKILIRLRSVLLLISQNQLILIEAWAESDLMFKASDRRRNEITFLLYGTSNQRPGGFTRFSIDQQSHRQKWLILWCNRDAAVSRQ